MEAVQPVIASNGVFSLQIRSVGSHSTPGREKEGNTVTTGREVWIEPLSSLFCAEA